MSTSEQVARLHRTSTQTSEGPLAEIAPLLPQSGQSATAATPCRIDPPAWDVDQASPLDLGDAIEDCRLRCPLLDACRRYIEAHPHDRAAMVWAGVAYNAQGEPLAATRGRSGRLRVEHRKRSA